MLRLESPRLLLRNCFSTAWLSSYSARCLTSVSGSESVASSSKVARRRVQLMRLVFRNRQCQAQMDD